MAFDFKNCSAEEREEECNRLAKEIGDDQAFTKKEMNHLPEILADGEQVLTFASGLMDGSTWLITLTNKRIIFLDKGMFYGLKQVTIGLDKINAISGKTGLFLGEITIQDSESPKTISNLQKRVVVPFTNKVRDAMEQYKMAKSSPAQHSEDDDMISKLERLAVLKEKGILSQEEFDQQKSKILDA